VRDSCHQIAIQESQWPHLEIREIDQQTELGRQRRQLVAEDLKQRRR
jgi:hypothetical protein